MDREISLTLLDTATTKALALSATSAQTAVINATDVVAVTLVCDVQFAACQGVNPTAVFPTTSTFGNDVIPANTKMRVIVGPGQKIAAILASGTGTMYYTVERL